MKATKITEGDIADMKVSALPTRPTAPTYFGGKGYTAAQVKAAFDRLPLYIVERYNELIDDITSDSFASNIAAPSGTLNEYLIKLREDVDSIAKSLNITL